MRAYDPCKCKRKDEDGEVDHGVVEVKKVEALRSYLDHEGQVEVDEAEVVEFGERGFDKSVENDEEGEGNGEERRGEDHGKMEDAEFSVARVEEEVFVVVDVVECSFVPSVALFDDSFEGVWCSSVNGCVKELDDLVMFFLNF